MAKARTLCEASAITNTKTTDGKQERLSKKRSHFCKYLRSENETWNQAMPACTKREGGQAFWLVKILGLHSPAAGLAQSAIATQEMGCLRRVSVQRVVKPAHDRLD